MKTTVIRLAGEYDIWDKRDSAPEVFQFGLRSRELSSQHWQELLDEPKYGTGLIGELLRDGLLLQRYQQEQDKSVMGRSFTLNWEGLTFLALNTPRCNSLTFAVKDNYDGPAGSAAFDALMGFYWDGGKWNVSLYHAKHRMDLDLSEIAKKHGGGGHRGACGFLSKSLPFLP